jgi:hypothetical protein
VRAAHTARASTTDAGQQRYHCTVDHADHDVGPERTFGFDEAADPSWMRKYMRRLRSSQRLSIGLSSQRLSSCLSPRRLASSQRISFSRSPSRRSSADKDESSRDERAAEPTNRTKQAAAESSSSAD